MRKQTFCIFDNKYAYQPRGNREAYRRLCFRYRDKFPASSCLLWLHRPVNVRPGRKSQCWLSRVASLARMVSRAIATGGTVTFLKLLFSQIPRKERKETSRLDLCQVLKCDVFHIGCPFIDTVASTHENIYFGICLKIVKILYIIS